MSTSWETTAATDVTKRERTRVEITHVGESDDITALHPFNTASLTWAYHRGLETYTSFAYRGQTSRRPSRLLYLLCT